MDIRLQTQGFDLTPAIDAHVRKELAQNFLNIRDGITAVDVFLSDINGPRGGEDKKALVRIQLASRLVVSIEKVHADLYIAMSKAARCASHTVKRKLRKQKRIQKTTLRKLRHFPSGLPEEQLDDGNQSSVTPAY